MVPLMPVLTCGFPMGAGTTRAPGCTTTGGYGQSAPVTGAARLYTTALLPWHGPQQQQVQRAPSGVVGLWHCSRLCRMAPSLPVPVPPSAIAMRGEKFEQKYKAAGQKPKSKATEPGSVPLPGGPAQTALLSKGKAKLQFSP